MVAIQRPDARQLHVGGRIAYAPGPMDRRLLVTEAAAEPAASMPFPSAVVTEGSELGLDGTAVVVDSLPDQQPWALAVLLTQLSRGLSADAVRRLRERASAEVARTTDDADRWAVAASVVPLNPSGGVAWELLGRAWEEPWDTADLQRVLASHDRPERLGVVMVGPGAPEEMLDQAELVLGGLAGGSGEALEPLPPLEVGTPWSGAPIVVVDDPGATRARIRGACLTELDDGARSAVAVAAVWDGVFNRVRRDRSQTYGPWVGRWGSGLRFALDVPADAAAETIAAIRGVLTDAEAGELPVGAARGRTAMAGPALGNPLAALSFALGDARIPDRGRGEGLGGGGGGRRGGRRGGGAGRVRRRAADRGGWSRGGARGGLRGGGGGPDGGRSAGPGGSDARSVTSGDGHW